MRWMPLFWLLIVFISFLGCSGSSDRTSTSNRVSDALGEEQTNHGPWPSASVDSHIMPAPNDIGAGEGMGPGLAGDRFDHIEEKGFLAAGQAPLSTFSIDG